MPRSITNKAFPVFPCSAFVKGPGLNPEARSAYSPLATSTSVYETGS
jgi:hypothetical protein